MGIEKERQGNKVDGHTVPVNRYFSGCRLGMVRQLGFYWHRDTRQG